MANDSERNRTSIRTLEDDPDRNRASIRIWQMILTGTGLESG